jgi:hypothetical protein
VNNWTLEIDFSVFSEMGDQIAAVVASAGPELFPRYSEAAETVSENAEILYKSYLQGNPLPNGKQLQKPAKSAAEGVQRRAAGALLWDIVNTDETAKEIEEGKPPFDMKTLLPTAKKARMSKDGTLYLIIPFRSGTPTAKYLNAMPHAVYKIAKQMTFSQNLGTVGTRMSATGHEVPKFGYKWGDKVSKQQLAAAGLSEEAQRRYSNMYRFNGPGQTTYITFRTMSQKSTGWIKKAVPGLFPLQTALQVAFDQGKDELAKAVQADFIAMLNGQT